MKGKTSIASIALILGSILFALLFVFLILFDKSADRLCSNLTLALFGIFFLLAGGVAFCMFSGKGAAAKRMGSVKYPALWIFAGYLILFILQLLVVRSVYFYTSWDVGVLREIVDDVLSGIPFAESEVSLDYSVHPNNLQLFYMFTLIERVGSFFGMKEPYHLCIYVSCFCVNFSGFLGQLTVNRLVRTPGVRILYAVIGAVLILFSPWIMIPYSDTYGMLFVALGCFGIVCIEKRWFRWLVVAFAALVGYGVKPSCIFPLFAVYLIYGTHYLCALKKNFREFLYLLASTVVFGCVSILLPVWIQYVYSFQLVPELKLPYSHYLMLGFNETMKGIYNHDDFLYSESFPDVESRTRANMERFKERVEDMADRGTLLYFLKEKALVNFNDGTFAWGEEGGFFLGQVEHDNILYDLFLKTTVPEGVWESGGEYYALNKTLRQGVWITVLLGIAFVFLNRREQEREKACLMTAVCGLLAFVMLFEARARYLFLYTPIFLVLSLCGYEALWQKGKDMFTKHGLRAAKRQIGR